MRKAKPLISPFTLSRPRSPDLRNVQRDKNHHPVQTRAEALEYGLKRLNYRSGHGVHPGTSECVLFRMTRCLVKWRPSTTRSCEPCLFAFLIRLLFATPCRKHDHANVISNRRAWETRMSLEEVLISVWWQPLARWRRLSKGTASDTREALRRSQEVEWAYWVTARSFPFFAGGA